MRLLQVATGPDQLLDLHPNVTVVTGLDDAARGRLIEAVTGLARGTAVGSRVLLEAHGVLFDLSPEVLALLDVVGDDLEPVVTADEVPLGGADPSARERRVAERRLAAVTERWEAARAQLTAAQGDVAAAAHALDRARQEAADAEDGSADRMAAIERLTSEVDQAMEHRRGLDEQLAELRPRVADASARRLEVEAATATVREERQRETARCVELTARVDQDSAALDPDAGAAAERAAQELAEEESEVEAERGAEGQAVAEVPAAEEEAPSDRLERLQGRIGELERQLAAFAPTEVEAVATALQRVRAEEQEEELVPMPEALALADELEALEAELVASSRVERVPGGLAESRLRLDDARQALLEAEQAARNPEVDRGLVDRLEMVHADLADAMDRAESRLGGARAQRKVDSLRAAEEAVLEEMGFASYADYMMGYSMLHVDPVKEEALDAAREELVAAEDAWNELQAETDAELARAELMERRRLAIEHTRRLLGQSRSTGSAVSDLRALRVPAHPHEELTDALRGALEEAGLALGEEELQREELVVVAKAWLAEEADAVTREQEIRAELSGLEEERTTALAAVEAESLAKEATAEDLREARLVAARQQVRAAEERRRAHLEAEARVEALTQELAEATRAERVATDAAAEADAAVDAAAGEEETLQAEIARIEEDLAAAGRTEEERSNELRELQEREDASSTAVWTDEVSRAEAAVGASEEALAEAQRAVDEADQERAEALSALELLPSDGGERSDESSVVEEIEWYLLARLAAQRHRSLGGSTPLVLDDALPGLSEEELHSVLGRLERMAEAVQVIVVTDDPLASSWALLAGADRAAMVAPQPA